MCSATHILLYSAVKCNFDYQVHVMGLVPYVGCAACSCATVMIHLYVYIYIYIYIKRMDRHNKW
jgi:hypothetical protein